MINHAEQTLDKQLILRISDLENQLRDLKTRQAIGGDTLLVGTSGQHSFVKTLTAGQTYHLVVSYYAGLKSLYDSELRPSYFIDTNANFNYIHPTGNLLSADQLLFEGSVRGDTSLSNELVDGTKSYVIMMKNTGTITKTVYLYFELLFPKQQLVAA